MESNSVKPSICSFLRLLGAIVILSFSAIFTKLSEADLSPSATVFDRYAIALFVLTLFQGLRGLTQSLQSLNLSKLSGESSESAHPSPDSPPLERWKPVWQVQYDRRDGLLLLGESIVSLLCVWLWAVSLTQTTVANSNLLHNLTPIFTTIGGAIFLGQTFDRRFLWGLGIALVATAGLQWQDWQVNPAYLGGDLLALLSAFFYGCGFLIREQLRRKFSTPTILFWSCACRTPIAFAIVGFLGDSVLPVTGIGWGAIVGLGVFVQLGGHGLLTQSLKHFSAGFTTICLLLDPVFTAVLAWVIFGESLNVWSGLAFVAVLGGIYLASTGKGSVLTETE